MNFSFSDSGSSFSSVGKDNVDDLDNDLFGSLGKPVDIDKKKSVTFTDEPVDADKQEIPSKKMSILKATPKKSLDDFLDDFDDNDPLAGLLSEESQQEPAPLPSACFPSQKKSTNSDEDLPVRKTTSIESGKEGTKASPSAKILSERKISKTVGLENELGKPTIANPQPSVSGPKVSKTADLGNPTGLSFSDDDDSLLDFGAKKTKSGLKIPSKLEEKAPIKNSLDLDTGAAGLGLGFTDDSESDLTFSEKPAKKVKSARAVSPVEEKNENDSAWLDALLGKEQPQDDRQPTHPVKTESETKIIPNESKSKLPQESIDFSAKSIDFSEDDTEQFLIAKSKKSKSDNQVNKERSLPRTTERNTLIENSTLNTSVQNTGVQKVEIDNIYAQLAELRAENTRLQQIGLQSVPQYLDKNETYGELDRYRSKIATLESENLEHVNRLKHAHTESVEIMKNEFLAQMERMKAIHLDEIEAFKSASRTTTDVKDILIKVDSATLSLHSIVERFENSNAKVGHNGELINEMNKLTTTIKLERKQFEAERERMLHLIGEMGRFNREQKEISEAEKFRFQSEIQRIETERRLLEEERRKLESELKRKNDENAQYKNRLLEEHQKQLIDMANQRHQIAKEWAELKSAKDSIFDMMKPEAFAQHEDNLRQAAASAAEVKVMKRELDFKLEQLNERRVELKQDLEMAKSERSEIQRQKAQLKRDEQNLKEKYSDFLSDTAEGRTALEAARRIEGNLEEKRKRIDLAVENLKNERVLLRHERQAVQNLQLQAPMGANDSFDNLPPLQPALSSLMVDDSFQADEFLNSLPPLNFTI